MSRLPPRYFPRFKPLKQPMTSILSPPYALVPSLAFHFPQGNIFELYRRGPSSEEHRQRGPVTVASTSGKSPSRSLLLLHSLSHGVTLEFSPIYLPLPSFSPPRYRTPLYSSTHDPRFRFHVSSHFCSYVPLCAPLVVKCLESRAGAWRASQEGLGHSSYAFRGKIRREETSASEVGLGRGDGMARVGNEVPVKDGIVGLMTGSGVLL